MPKTCITVSMTDKEVRDAILEAAKRAADPKAGGAQVHLEIPTNNSVQRVTEIAAVVEFQR